MKKSFSHKKIQKKNRGVAVIFTLGILGLLTVMALGFASTALLNRKIADNTSSQDYARHIAKNIALARAKNAVMRNAVISNYYYSEPISGQSNAQDFLYKMDTVLDGVELYRVTNNASTPSYLTNTARWQYVTDPNDNNRILGRYAYAVVPVSGHLDPVGNRGQRQTSGPERDGFSEKEIGVFSMCSGETGLNKNAVDAGVAGTKFRTFKEFVAAFKDLDSDKRKNLLTNGYRIQLGSSPEAFWIDTKQDGKKSKDELYLRFNMPTSSADWNKISVEELIGEKKRNPATDELESLVVSDDIIKYTGSKKSITFIPWLKYWNHSVGSSWTADLMKKQIAANIIQYNRPGPDNESPSKTISDKMGDSDDWLDDDDPPAYAGIGRHPMLNEIGFSIRVKAEVERDPTPIATDPYTFKYTAKYIITVDNGVELINPFSQTPSFKCHVKFSDAQEINIKLRAFKDDLTSATIGSDSDLIKLFYEKETTGFWIFGETSLKLLNLKIKGNQASRQLQKITDSFLNSWLGNRNTEPDDAGTPNNIKDGGWTNFEFAREFPETDWSSAGYTKAANFWNQQTKTVIFNDFTIASSSDEDYSGKIKRLMRLYQARIKFGNTVLYFGEDATIPNQRDFAKLSDTSEIKLKDCSWNDLWNDTEGGQDISTKAWLGMISVEAKDPLVNHYVTDWTKCETTYDGVWDEDDPQDKIEKKYPGTVFDKSNGSPGDDAYHLNSAAKASGSPVALLKDKEMKADGSGFEDVNLESATDPACSNSSRLSSSYIRHAPMKSFWELGFISRAEAFKTLNLGRVRVFEPGTAYDARGGGTFEQGDANILDQIKFSDTTDQKDVQGKIDINARYHKVFEWVFNQDVATSAGTTVSWYTNLISPQKKSELDGVTVDPYDATTIAGTTQNVVCDNSSSSCLTARHSDSCTVSCLAHLLMERSMILPFRNRSDMLLDPDSTVSDFTKIPGYSDLSSDAQTKLKTIQRKLRRYLLNPKNESTDNAKSKLVREQYATRFMNLFKADDNDEHVYIIVLAQSIKDVGGSPVLVDWNGDGEYSSSALTIPSSDNAKMKKFLRTGYIRKKLDGSADYEKIGSVASVNETITSPLPAVGTYDHGADKITGETKLIVEMAKDANTGKWKMAGYRYVE